MIRARRLAFVMALNVVNGQTQSAQFVMCEIMAALAFHVVDVATAN